MVLVAVAGTWLGVAGAIGTAVAVMISAITYWMGLITKGASRAGGISSTDARVARMSEEGNAQRSSEHLACDTAGSNASSPPRGADLRHAVLTSARLVEADLRHVDLRGADLRMSDLRAADLRNADLTGADLSGAQLGPRGTWHASSSSDLSEPSTPANGASTMSAAGRRTDNAPEVPPTSQHV